MKNRFWSLLLVFALLLGGCTPALNSESTGKETTLPLTESTAETNEVPTQTAPPSPEELANTAPIAEGSHPREDDYLATFKTHFLSLGQVDLHMENQIYQEKQLRRAAQTLLEELTAAETALGVKPEPITVYLVREPLGGYAMSLGSQVFCSPEELENGTARDDVLGAAYGLELAWQRAGLAEYLFGEADDEGLRAYYADDSHVYTASCTPIFLSPLIADEETVRAARSTARSLTAFLLEREGFQAFRETRDVGPLLPAWQESLGIETPLRLPEKSEVLAEMELVTNHSSSCLLRLNNLSFAFKDESWLDPWLYGWLCNYFAGMDKVLERICTEAPSVAELAEENMQKPIWFSVEDNPYGISWAFGDTDKVLLDFPQSVWHETTHILLPNRFYRRDLDWQVEGATEHFCAPGTEYYWTGFADFEEFLTWVFQESGEMGGDDLVFYDRVEKIYEALRDPNAEGFIYETFVRAYGIAALLMDESLSRSEEFKFYDTAVGSLKGEEAASKAKVGNALSYPEAMVMVEYAMERFGPDAVTAAAVEGKSVEEAFDIDYETLYAAAVEHYGALYLEQSED